MLLLLPLLLACGDRTQGEELVSLVARPAGATGCPDLYYDADGDGYGDVDLVVRTCDEPAGYSPYGTDCDDISPLAFPGATEVCGNGQDEDCDGQDLACDLPASGELSTFGTRVGSTTSDDDPTHPVALADVDGDGQADILLGRPDIVKDGGRVRVLLGPLEAERDDWDLELGFFDAAPYAGLGSSLVGGFDMDGDGLDDLAIGAPGLTFSDIGTVYLLPGPIGPSTTPDIDGRPFYTSLGYAGFGTSLVGGGDITGDGVADLVVGACCDGSSPSWVMPGPITYSSVAANGHAITPNGSLRQSFVAMVMGDATGDGIADLAVGESPPDSGIEKGRAYLIEGPVTAAMDLTDAGTRLDSSESADGFGAAVLLADFDDDGLDDLVVGARQREVGGVIRGMVMVLSDPAGRGAVFDTTATTTLYGSSSDAYMGFSLAALQLDGVGAPELLAGAPGLNGLVGGTYAWLDVGAGGTRTSADRAWLGTSATGIVGYWMTAGADVDGDGALDAMVAGIDAGSGGDAWLIPGL